jgi:hypothetical protein
MPRFLTLADVAEILNVSAAQAYALVRSRLEDYICSKYAETAARFTDA